MKYLASPYTHEDQKVMDARFNAVCMQTAMMLKAGIHVHSPIVHSVPLLKYGVPSTWDFWRGIDFATILLCDELLVLELPGWDESKGVLEEMQYAKEIHRPVIRVAPYPEVMDELTKTKLEWE